MQRISDHPDFYESLVFNSSDLIAILTPEGEYKYVTNSVKAILGYTPSELKGQNALSYIHPEDVNIALEALEQVQQVEMVHIAPFRFKDRQGQWRWLDCVVKDMTADKNINGIVSNARDVTDKVEAEHRLATSEAYYSSLFFNHPDAAYALNPAGIFETLNKQAGKILGFTNEEIIGRHYRQFLVPDFIPTADAAFESTLKGNSNTLEVAVLHKNGQKVWLNITVVPILLNGQVMGMHGIAKDITELKNAQDTIREQAELLKNVFGSITEGFFVVDKEWKITYANPYFVTFFGLQLQQYLGRSLWEMLPFLVDTRFYQVCQQVAENNGSVHFDEFFPERQQVLTFAVYAFSGGITIYFDDVTTKKKKEEELADLALVASKITNGVVIMDAEGKIEWVNEAFSRLTGYSCQEVIGQIPSVLLQGPDSDPVASARIYQKYQEKVPFSEEILNYKKNGEILWFHIDVTPVFDMQGNLVKYIAIENDVTELKKDEAEMVKLTEDLVRRNEDLQQFTYMVSHNLRAPAANLLGLSRLLTNEDKFSARFDQALTKLSAVATHLDMVINDLSKIISPVREFRNSRQERVNVSTVVDQVLVGLEDQLEAVNAIVVNNLSSELVLPGTTAYFYSIFHNLFSNALKYRHAARRPEISIQMEEKPGEITIIFADNGLGIELEKVNKDLFKLYKRFHPEVDGRGIGLYLVKQQVESMGGTIAVESMPGEGTKFLLTFNL